MFPSDNHRSAQTEEVVENVRNTVGEKAVELTADYFEDQYRAKQRETTLKAFGAGIAIGAIATAAAIFRRR